MGLVLFDVLWFLIIFIWIMFCLFDLRIDCCCCCVVGIVADCVLCWLIVLFGLCVIWLIVHFVIIVVLLFWFLLLDCVFVRSMFGWLFDFCYFRGCVVLCSLDLLVCLVALRYFGLMFVVVTICVWALVALRLGCV